MLPGKKGRIFTPPGAGKAFKEKIINRMLCKPTRALKQFADDTGLDHESLRKWTNLPIIPFMLAEFVAIWLNLTLEQLMELGVRLTLQQRELDLELRAPNFKTFEGIRFRTVAGVLQVKGCRIIKIVEGQGRGRGLMEPILLMEPIFEHRVERNLQIQSMEDQARRLIEEFAEKDIRAYGVRA